MILYYFDKYHAFKKAYDSQTVISEVISQWPQYKAAYREANDLIGSVQKSTRENHHKQCLEHVRTLKEIDSLLDESKDDLNIKIKQDNRRTRVAYLALGFSFLTLAATVYILYMPKV